MTQPTLYRLVTGDIAAPEPRVLTGRAVPYDTPADVADLLPDGTFDTYREGFRSTAFVSAFDQPHRVRLVDQHYPDGTFGPDLGIARAMRHADDETGLEIEFRLLTEETAEKVRTLVEEGVTGLSVGFSPVRGGTVVDTDGTRWRTRAVLRHVSLEAAGSYAAAQVLAMRGDQDDQVAAADREYEQWAADLDAYMARAAAEQAEWDAKVHPEPAGGT